MYVVALGQEKKLVGSSIMLAIPAADRAASGASPKSVKMTVTDALAAQGKNEGYILACQAGVSTDRRVEA